MNSGAHPPAFFADMWRTVETGHAWRGDICYRAKDGSRYWADTIIVPLADQDGAPNRYISLSYDVTAHKKVAAVAERKQKIGQLIAAMQGELIASGAISVSLKQSLTALLPIVGADVAIVLDVGRTQSGELWCNVACDCRANANQVAFAEEPVLINLRSQPPLIRECGSAGLIFGGRTSQELGASTFKAIPIRSGAATIGLLAIGGERVISEAFMEELEPFAAAVGDLIVAQREADQRRTAADEARLLARQDALTGLGNRRALVEEFDARTDHPDAKFSLLLIDLDRFKPINDTHGHMIGDEVLKVISARLRACVRRDCAVVRLGGDEFAILTEPRHDERGVEELVARVLDQLPAPIEINGLTLSVGASVGVARYPGDAKTANDLLQRADAAMYRAKERRGDAQFFNSSMDLRIRQKAALETALRDAVANDQIAPYYQPIVRLDTGEVVGHEVLARWRHDELGFIPPAQFIPIAEEAGLIESIFWSVLRTAAKKYQDTNCTTLLSVNLSPAQIKDPLLAQRLLQALAETGLPPQRLEIELTETAMLVDIERARALIVSLKNQGIQIALDDFGTGYSSLVLLRDLPIDKLKIDRSFIGAIDADTSASTVIVDAVLGLAKAMSLAVTAEGIETETVANLLRSRGCQYGQGYLFGAATPAPVFEIDGLKRIGSQAA
jgi:diguanylate cyclase (GGDEF)-like protein